jgi:hypothetical protein
MVLIIWQLGPRRLEVHVSPEGRVAVLLEGERMLGAWSLPARVSR